MYAIAASRGDNAILQKRMSLRASSGIASGPSARGHPHAVLTTIAGNQAFPLPHGRFPGSVFDERGAAVGGRTHTPAYQVPCGAKSPPGMPFRLVDDFGNCGRRVEGAALPPTRA